MWHDRTLEAVGSTPIGSTKFFKGLDIVRPLDTLPELPIVRMLSECFQLPAVIEVTVVGSCFCFANRSGHRRAKRA